MPRCATQLNFQEFFGFYATFHNECEESSGGETYREYLANGVGIALAAFFAIPSIRGETTKSPGVRYGSKVSSTGTHNLVRLYPRTLCFHPMV